MRLSQAEDPCQVCRYRSRSACAYCGGDENALDKLREWYEEEDPSETDEEEDE